MLNFKLPLGVTLLAVAAHSGAAAAATVSYPYLDVIQEGSDSGVAAVGAVPSLTMQGTAISIVTGPGSNTLLATPATFTLSATYSASLTAVDTQPNSYDFTNGTLTIGASGSPALLTATFSDLTMQSDGTSLYNYVVGSSPLLYTGGTLAGSLPGGEIIGSFTVTSAALTNTQGNAELSSDFYGDNLTAKVGAVVPLPATLWLLLSGLGGCGALARKRIVGA